ncbi:class I SAM-dependent methyltransferase [Sulfitobacter sp. 915]|uniref:class I SAM-dependent methyltransferase n=1 Tax=Sulfitobacter sp. 915 TaxID=3368558 RepID=UPI0037476540
MERPDCPVCGKLAARNIWSGQLDDPSVLSWLEKYYYSGPWREQIAGQEFSLVQCVQCGMHWHRNVISDTSVATVYGIWADAEQARRFEEVHVPSKHDQRALRVQMAKLALRLEHLAKQNGRPLQLLDFGCGDGVFLSVAKALGADAMGIDVSASRTQGARSTGLTVLPDLAALDAQSQDPLDAVVLSQVLEHVSDPLALLRALHGRLREGGILFVAVPNAHGVSVPQNFHQFTLVQPIEHMNAFSPATLRLIGQKAGFTPVRRPSAFVTTKSREVLRAAANWVWQPQNTDVFFRKEKSRLGR